jgi:hypothetical protein
MRATSAWATSMMPYRRPPSAPPFEAHRLEKILSNDGLMKEAIKMAELIAEPLADDDDRRSFVSPGVLCPRLLCGARR